MKKFLISIGFLLSFLVAAMAQESNPELQIPGTPGMNIIGVQTAEITKPGNYTGVFTSLISPIISNNGTIPADLALEFSPYYLESRDITWKELYNTNIYRDLRISIASNNVMDSDSNLFSRVGIGFRTNLIAGNINIKDENKIKLSTANDINTTILMIQSGLYDPIDEANVNKLVDHIADKILKQRITKIIIENKNNKGNLVNELTKLNAEIDKLIIADGSRWDYSLRTGHFIEIAGAFAIDFPKNTIDFSELNRWGIWFNYTYRPEKEKQSIDFSAILRLSNFSFDPTIIFENGSVFGDFGVSINWKIPKSEFIVSGEIIGKAGFSDFKASDGKNEYTFKSVTESKWNCAIGYQITPNILWSISLSDINGNSSYLKNNSLQFLMGLSAALAPLQK